MYRKEQIKRLKEQIDYLKVELGKIDYNKPKMTAKEYIFLSNIHKSYVNMILIAENELRALLHLYSLSLYGEVADNKGQVFLRKKHVKLFTEIDSRIVSKSKNIRLNPDLMSRIKEEFSLRFNEGNFEVTSIKQIR